MRCNGNIRANDPFLDSVTLNIDGHHYVDGDCEYCGEDIEPSAASTLSEGNVTLLVGIACLAVGFVTATLMNRRKKAAPAQDKE